MAKRKARAPRRPSRPTADSGPCPIEPRPGRPTQPCDAGSQVDVIDGVDIEPEPTRAAISFAYAVPVDGTLDRRGRVGGLSRSAWFLLRRLYELDRDRQVMLEHARPWTVNALLLLSNLEAEWQGEFLRSAGTDRRLDPEGANPRDVRIVSAAPTRAAVFMAMHELLRHGLARMLYGDKILEITLRGRWLLRPQDRLDLPSIPPPIPPSKRPTAAIALLDGVPFLVRTRGHALLMVLRDAYPDHLAHAEVVRRAGWPRGTKAIRVLDALPREVGRVVQGVQGLYRLAFPLLPRLPGNPTDWTPPR